MTEEEKRLAASRERTAHWKRWGPYLSERAWGTVREDYSASGAAWDYFPHDHARSRVYRWNEDGLAGFCDRHQQICFALALWNEQDAILKERLFGLTGQEGNHAEDVKEYYYYLDNTPTHSYMKYLYKYPHTAFPYQELLQQNLHRNKHQPEFELLDTGIFDENRYFDIYVEYAKADVEDMLICITVHNRGPEPAPLHVLPTIWFRNDWSWSEGIEPPVLQISEDSYSVQIEHQKYGTRRLYAENNPALLFTENATNVSRLFNVENSSPYVKDSINDYIVQGSHESVNPACTGTKAAAHYKVMIPPGESKVFRLRFTDQHLDAVKGEPWNGFSDLLRTRRNEADAFYSKIIPDELSEDNKQIMRQAFAGMLWSKQFYHYAVEQWLKGDVTMPAPPNERKTGRNRQWPHLYNRDVISMPDAWEYPWYATWDLAFHCLPLAQIDADFAKEQLILVLREWYMHPNGQLPAYEWALGDVNPPVHAWAAWRVYKMEEKRVGIQDRVFLERVFHKLMLNFTWWVNRKDFEDNNLFQGGFLGLDNIGIFDRSAPLPTGGHLEQSDGTSWMAMYCLNMLSIALELSSKDPAYEDVASKFWEHFMYIAHAMNNMGDNHMSMWDEEDGFYYSLLHTPDDRHIPMKVRSMVGLIPLFAVDTLEPGCLSRLPDFKRRMEWFIENRPDLTRNLASMTLEGIGERRLLSILRPDQLRRVLTIMLDEEEFLSPYGLRSLSKYHQNNPFIMHVDGTEYRVDYTPAESVTRMFGGNSNWRGPVWFPLNYLIIESLQKYHHYFGDDFQIECPTGSGCMMTLGEVARDLSRRLSRLFVKDENGQRPVYGSTPVMQNDPHWRDHILFYEYFHGDTGIGLGASHQTGWTGLVAKLLQQSGA